MRRSAQGVHARQTSHVYLALLVVLAATVASLFLATGVAAGQDGYDEIESTPPPPDDPTLDSSTDTTTGFKAATWTPKETVAAAPGESTTVVDYEPSTESPIISGELIVKYAGEPPSDLGAGEQVAEEFSDGGGAVVYFPEIQSTENQDAREFFLEEKKEELEANPDVELVGYNHVRQPHYTPNDTYFDKQWNLPKTYFPEAYDLPTASGVKVAVLDTGIDLAHPDFSGKIGAQRDFVNRDAEAAEDSSTSHGTHVAGVVGAKTNDTFGVASGCPSCQLLIGKIADANTETTVNNIREGVNWAVENGAKVVNISFGGDTADPIEQEAIANAIAADVVVVASVGNLAPDPVTGAYNPRPFYPAAYDKVIGVGSTTTSDTRAAFSNYGSFVDVVAPGVDVLSTVKGGWGYRTGTSMSAPLVAAEAALIRGRGQNASNTANYITSYSTDLGGYYAVKKCRKVNGKRRCTTRWYPYRPDYYHGWGIIHAYKSTYYAPQTS